MQPVEPNVRIVYCIKGLCTDWQHVGMSFDRNALIWWCHPPDFSSTCGRQVGPRRETGFFAEDDRRLKRRMVTLGVTLPSRDGPGIVPEQDSYSVAVRLFGIVPAERHLNRTPVIGECCSGNRRGTCHVPDTSHVEK